MVSSPRVLLIDDEPVVRLTLGANLELAGFDVETADSVASALLLVQASRFDCVVSDVRMPDVDGVSGLEQLRAIQPDLPAIFVTGYDPDSVIPAALARGAFTVLAKPVPMATLTNVVRACLSDPVVLVVDDEPAFLEALVESLRAGGLKAERAASGEEARALVATRSVDVCVLDLVLGGGTGDEAPSGVEVLADLHGQQPGLSVIAMTGHQVGDLVREVLRGGALHCLKKPFEMNVLARLIARARAESPPTIHAKP